LGALIWGVERAACADVVRRCEMDIRTVPWEYGHAICKYVTNVRLGFRSVPQASGPREAVLDMFG
jgi:hypothetical protein